jgi:hypothetical protein
MASLRPLRPVDVSIVRVAAEAASHGPKRSRRHGRDRPEQVQRSYIGDFRRTPGTRGFDETRGEEDAGKRRLMGEWHVELRADGSGRSERKDSAAADPPHVELPDRLPCKWREQVERSIEPRRDRGKEVALEPDAKVEQRSHVRNTVWNAERVGNELVLVE